MTSSRTNSLWFKQTVYSVVVVAIIAAGIAGFEIRRSYQHEHNRLQEFGDELLAAFVESAARSAFHIDSRQAETIVEGLMQYDVLAEVSISTNLGVVLARQTRDIEPNSTKFIADWLFADVSSFNAGLSIDRSEFISGIQHLGNGPNISVGMIEIHADSTILGRTYINEVRGRIIDLVVEFLILAAAFAFISYKTITKPLVNVAGQLGSIDPQGMHLADLKTPRSHENDELGLVVSKTNELLKRIGEQQLDLVHREKVAALGSMLAELAHELNNPLAVVTAQSELLAETATDEISRARAQKILKPALRSASIVRKFLTLTRQRRIEKTVVDVSRLINESVEMLSYQFTNANISVNVDIDPLANRIWGDGPQLSQVLINILVNSQQAVDGIEGDRQINIRAFPGQNDKNVIISITDNGPGIPTEIRSKVFNYFFTTKPEGRGTGLGLSVCKSVIEGHGGSIVINDVAPHGTEVVIELPGTDAEDIETSARAHPGQVLTALRVLVVDDEASLASSIAEVLMKYGHSAVIATNAEQALCELNTGDFDVILADVHMPKIDGMEFYKRTRAIDKSLAEKFIFITGDALDQALVRFFDQEKRPYLNKPFEIGELISAVENVLLSPKTNQPEDHTGVGEHV
jgi:signal transduction histidine kinase/ActR/RegA family two-component response regulator